MGEYFLIAMVIGSGFYIGWNCTKNILDLIGIGLRKLDEQINRQSEPEAEQKVKNRIGFDY